MIRNPYPCPRRIGGFTLIELMAVIGIMLTVLFIALPALNQVRKIAKGESVKAFMGNVNVALSSYTNTYREAPPSSTQQSSSSIVAKSTLPMFGLNRSVMTSWEGADFLCQALTGASNNDGKVGLGYLSDGVTIDAFITPKERIYETNKKKFFIDMDPKADFNTGNRFVFTGIPGDEFSPILYYAKQLTGEIDRLDSSRAIWSANGQYATKHNEKLVKEINEANGKSGVSGDSVRDFLTKSEANGGAKDMDRDGLERSLRSSKYLMVWPGIDFIFGTDDDIFITGP